MGLSIEGNEQGDMDPPFEEKGQWGAPSIGGDKRHTIEGTRRGDRGPSGESTVPTPWRVLLPPALHPQTGIPIPLPIPRHGRSLFHPSIFSIEGPLFSFHGGCLLFLLLSLKGRFLVPLPIHCPGESSFPFVLSLHGGSPGTWAEQRNPL